MLAIPFEESMVSLGHFLRRLSSFRDFTYPIADRMQSLHYRCKLASLEENCRMLMPILEMGRLSQHAVVLAQGLSCVTIESLERELHQIKDSIMVCHSKGLHRLEVELRLIRLAAGLAMDSVGLQGTLMGANAELSSVAKLCQRFPQTAGPLLTSYNRIQSFLSRNKNLAGHPIYTKTCHETWWTWPKHGTGNLKQCENGHPYSGMTMIHCPECGPENKDEKLREIDTNTRMRPQDFIAAMKSQSFDGSSYYAQK